MTRVEIQARLVTLPESGEDTQLLCLAVKGHAGYGEKGKDIVCAAESALVQALAGWLARQKPAMLYDFAVDGRAGSGCVGITAVPTAAGCERVRGAFESAVTGFCLLSAAYPENVAVAFGHGQAAEQGGRDDG